VSATLLILTPLLVLGVVLLLGFAGCEFDPGRPPVPPTLVFRATVPAAYAVLAVNPGEVPGVKFFWKRPGGTWESLVVTTPTEGMDGVTHVHVYEANIATPGNGGWTGRCDMRVQEGNTEAPGSVMHDFTPDFANVPHTAVTFRGEGSPQANLFAVVFRGPGPA
jgi:hypothetical protein